MSTAASIVNLFTPWKHVMKRMQTKNIPSPHLAVTSYWYVLLSLVITKEVATDEILKGKG
jgi:hypothetical protein